MILGVKQQSFDMGVWGAPGCKLLVSLDVMLPAMLTSTGAIVGPISLPSSLAGTTVFTQWLMTDNANAFGVVASDGRRLEIK